MPRVQIASLSFSLFALAWQQGAATLNETRPIEKVVTLLTDMKANAEQALSDDQNAYSKYQCWCETNKKEKSEAVESAEKAIAELQAFIESADALQAQLKSEIEALATSIQNDKDSLAEATSIREKETAAFNEESEDMKEVIATLKQAVEVLAKVQLLQRSGDQSKATKPLLLQFREVVRSVHDQVGAFRGAMQKDLWDVLSSLDDVAGGASFLPRRQGMSALEEAPLVGAAAGAKSYNSRSGSVLGVLAGMSDNFKAKLADAEKAELQAEKEFQQLKASKVDEIEAATEQQNQKETLLADTVKKAANADEDIEATKNALSADEKFLLGLEKDCKAADEAFADRSKIRAEELQALGDAIKILTEDDARDLFSKTMSFMQITQQHMGHAVVRSSAAASKVLNRAMAGVLRVAHKQGNWMLASLAVRARLDDFTKVKEAMDNMTADLKAQQQAEYEKRELCNKELDDSEDSLKTKNLEKEDLESLKLSLEGSISKLSGEIDALKSEVGSMQVSLKSAGEERKAQNEVFQRSVSDARATVNILNKAMARLKKFYTPKSLMQVRVHAPGAPSSAPPASGKEYQKSGGAGGVLTVLSKIISDAESSEAVLMSDEQHAQQDYASLAADSTASIEAANGAILEKSKQQSEAAASLSETEGSLTAKGDEIAQTEEMLKGLHMDCDWLIKFYDLRAKARSEELSAIAEAKAILSGANFGKAMEEGDDAAEAA